MEHPRELKYVRNFGLIMRSQSSRNNRKIHHPDHQLGSAIYTKSSSIAFLITDSILFQEEIPEN